MHDFEEPFAEEPIADEQVIEEQVAGETVTDKPAVDEAVSGEAAGEEPAGEGPDDQAESDAEAEAKAETEEATYEDVPLDDVTVPSDLPLNDTEQLAYKLLKRATAIKGVAIDRDAFLRAELAGVCASEMIEEAVASSPHKAGVRYETADKLADAAIALEAGKVAGLSALAGIPGGVIALGAIPADILQYFAHALRVAQKLSYLYGWESMDLHEGDADDEALYQLILLLGVMMNVEGTGAVLAGMATDATELGFPEVLRQAHEKDDTWYLPIKKVLSVVGTNVTKGAFAEVAARGIPGIAGLLSGTMTFVTFRFGSLTLKKLLRELPQATCVAGGREELLELAARLEEEAKADYADMLRAAVESAGEKAGVFAAQAGEVADDLVDRAGDIAAAFAEQASVAAGVVVDKAAEYATIARDKAGEAAKAAAIGFIRGLGTKKKERRRQKEQEAQDAQAAQQQTEVQESSVNNVAQELRMLKSLLDEGIITQEEFDAKKRQILGL